MRVLVVGSGGREHTLAWAISRSQQVTQVYVAQGNAGTQWVAGNREGLTVGAPCQNTPIASEDVDGLLRFAQENAIDLTVVGPEVPLVNGIVDRFQAQGLRIFGASQQAARLEGSKAFSKQFMTQNSIPTADYAICHDLYTAQSYIRAVNRPLVVKADGLAAGKGVIVCDTPDQAISAAHHIMATRAFGSAGDVVVVEERLTGREISLLAFCDGKTAKPMVTARDHKRALDGDRGLNTGGMGAVAPSPDIKQSVIDEIMSRVVQPTLDGMNALGTPFVGVLFVGVMLTPKGIMTLEFNCRFGDPETQVILPLLETDIIDVFNACIDGTLDALDIQWSKRSCATIVLASGGYPSEFKRGYPIQGLEKPFNTESSIIFHAGTTTHQGRVVTNGGRVLAMTGIGRDLEGALNRAYRLAEMVHFEQMHFRRDIGKTVTSQLPTGGHYAQAGVNIDAGQHAVELMKESIKATYTPNVLSDTGHFGGLFAVDFLKGYENPILVASTDGVGTKTKVASHMQKWDTIGQDLVNHCINDILVQGATPLFFMDYVASSQLDPVVISTVVKGMAYACRVNGCALLGGETAEMPSVYHEGELDVVGTLVGVVDQMNLVTGERVREGDAIISLPSTGLHTNGYSLARQILRGLDWKETHPKLGTSIGNALLAVHRAYLSEYRAMLSLGVDIRGMAHITGGGILDNLPRVLPEGLGASIAHNTWDIPPIFTLIQELGGIDEAELFRVFNMGLGMVFVMPAHDVDRVLKTLTEARHVGIITRGKREVTLMKAED